MKFLTYFMIILALCSSTRCWSMNYSAPRSSTRVMTQQEYQQYLAQQAQTTKSPAPTVTQPQPIQPAQPQVTTQPPVRQTKVKFAEEVVKKTPTKYEAEVTKEEEVAASVEPTSDADELAKRKRIAIRKSKWAGVSEDVAAQAELEKEEAAEGAPKGKTTKQLKEERQQHMKELGIKLEKAPGSFW